MDGCPALFVEVPALFDAIVFVMRRNGGFLAGSCRTKFEDRYDMSLCSGKYDRCEMHDAPAVFPLQTAQVDT